MNKRYLLPLIAIPCILTVLLIPVRVTVFATSNTLSSTIPDEVITVFGNLTLQLRNFTLAFQPLDSNETYTIHIQKADIKILTRGYHNRTTKIDIIAYNSQLTGANNLSFNYLELHLTLIQDTLTSEAVTTTSLWKLLLTRL